MTALTVFLVGIGCGALLMVCLACCALSAREYPQQPASTPAPLPAPVDCHDGCAIAAQRYEIRALPEVTR